MKGKDKTKEQLISELVLLRRQVSEVVFFNSQIKNNMKI